MLENCSIKRGRTVFSRHHSIQRVVNKTINMFKFVVLAACVAAANAGLIAAPGLAVAQGFSVASGPALGAPLLGRTSVNPTEVNIVKQQVVVDQPEIRYRSVPTVVQTAPIVQNIVAAPAVQTVVAPAPAVAAVRTVAAPAEMTADIWAAASPGRLSFLSPLVIGPATALSVIQ